MQYLLLITTCICLIFCSCNTDQSADSKQSAANLTSILKEGKQLSVKYCGNCHQYPQPELLDKATWRSYILPRMGYMMGIYDQEKEKVLSEIYEPNQARQIVEAANIFPPQAQINPEDWKKITTYYLQSAPDSLTNPASKPITNSLSQFKIRKPEYTLSPPSTTMIHINEDQTFFIGDANTKSLLLFDKQLKLKNAANVREGAVSLSTTPNQLRVTVMGSFSPTDLPSGFLLNLPKNTQSKPQILIDKLQRPVHTAFADLNQDGQEDIVICEFAKWTGGLSWWENQNGTFVRHLLRNKPGAIKTHIQDFDGDQRPDLMALFGQGDEGIFLYTNQGNGQFSEKRILQFPSSYGSSYFDVLDFDKDGYLDILYTAGDNADYRPLTKPYHGVYLYLNDGKNNFKQTFFYALPGAYKVIPQDFDEDGDLDLAAIAFFPDYYQKTALGFVYLKNQGKMNFSAETFPEVQDGRWIVMDAGDLDGDKDTDIILGSLAFEVVPKNGLLEKWVNRGLPFVVLENTRY
ncbi:MAG: VCBS repeat-containing protein [Microscillaceae bacterium]|nr:VCBS repeat-containing protein [Microscillaceae bacterium]